MGKLKKITRDKDGLISDGSVEYVFADSGLIDWRKMLKTEHLVPNKDRTSETDVTKLKDYQLIILLGGIKELAQVRGYTNVNYDIHSPSPEYVVATCSITWIPNYETENKEYYEKSLYSFIELYSFYDKNELDKKLFKQN